MHAKKGTAPEAISPYENTLPNNGSKADLQANAGTEDILKERMRTMDNQDLGSRHYSTVASKSMKGIKTYVGGGQAINMSRHKKVAMLMQDW